MPQFLPIGEDRLHHCPHCPDPRSQCFELVMVTAALVTLRPQGEGESFLLEVQA